MTPPGDLVATLPAFPFADSSHRICLPKQMIKKAWVGKGFLSETVREDGAGTAAATIKDSSGAIVDHEDLGRIWYKSMRYQHW